MKEINLTQNKVALVDDKDYEWLSQWKWCVAFFDGRWYACRGFKKNKKSSLILMHREILGLIKNDGKIGDHKNRNSLNNCRENLRIASPTLNSFNCKMRQNNTSEYRGVYWKKNNRNWQAQISIEGIAIHCGCYPDKILAAKAYDQAAIKYRGQDAVLNFPKEVEYVL